MPVSRCGRCGFPYETREELEGHECDPVVYICEDEECGGVDYYKGFTFGTNPPCPKCGGNTWSQVLSRLKNSI